MRRTTQGRGERGVLPRSPHPCRVPGNAAGVPRLPLAPAARRLHPVAVRRQVKADVKSLKSLQRRELNASLHRSRLTYLMSGHGWNG